MKSTTGASVKIAKPSKRGRPKGNGDIDLARLMRDGLAMAGYHDARRKGHKHEVAISAGSAKVAKWFPDSPNSTTTVRRILADYGRDKAKEILFFSETELCGLELAEQRRIWSRLDKLNPEMHLLDREQGRPLTFRVLRTSYQSVPQYPRSNAVIR